MEKKIFSDNADINKIAFLNWRTSKHEDIGNMLALAEGFLASAIQLAKDCIYNNDDKKADILIFPILTNANHGIELYLKSLIWTLNRLQKSEMKIEGIHNIQQMYQTCEAKIQSLKDADWHRHFRNQNLNLKEYIEELFDLTSVKGKKDNMDFSRYPLTNKYENHFYIDRLDNVKIDLENFVDRFERIKESLNERASYFFFQELNGE